MNLIDFQNSVRARAKAVHEIGRYGNSFAGISVAGHVAHASIASISDTNVTIGFTRTAEVPHGDALGFADESGVLRLAGGAGEPGDVLLFDLPG